MIVRESNLGDLKVFCQLFLPEQSTTQVLIRKTWPSRFRFG
ncbi:hypothetical protein FRUB_09084 [Fimbriiglobus ruber]|uniref:Uncharacterized protein n=1 Tax=Fimbriiglobus ruber TaxID=1908690 RepID=A0A225D4J3_9BACT|nr:hypothetical protein FRUB_09084 [Fimbriiglobus ruber]